MNDLLKKLNKEVKPKIMDKFGLTNSNMVPVIKKVSLNAGIRSDLKDSKVLEEFVKDLAKITGQVPIKTRAKQSISSFKVRQNQVVGLMVTLRGKRMYDFLDKFFNVTLPRVRDFRGLDQSGFDNSGNFSIGFRDQIAFPEISADSVSHLFGLQVTIVLEARTKDQAVEFLKLLGLPIKNKEQ